MASSQGIPEDIKQQLAGKEEEKKRAKQKSDELVAKRERLENKLLETSDKDQAAKVQASIDGVKDDLSRVDREVHDLNEQIKFLLGKKKKRRKKSLKLN